MKRKFLRIILVAAMALGLTARVAAVDYGEVIHMVPLVIEEFSFGKVDGDYLRDVRFTVSGGEGGYGFAIAVGVMGADGALEGSREFYESTAALDENVRIDCYLGGLSSYNAYSLALYVWKDYDGLELSGSAVAEGVFSYTNKNSPPPITDFSLLIDMTANTAYVGFEQWAAKDAQGYLVSMDDGSPEVYYVELYPDEYGIAIPFAQDAASITVEVSYKNSDGLLSRALGKTVGIEDLLDFKVAETTSGAQVAISYSVDREINLRVYVTDGTALNPSADAPPEEIRIFGDGFFSVNIGEHESLITLEYDLGDNITVMKQASVYRDAFAPSLILPEHSGAVYTADDSFTIAGITESGASVAVNGVPADVGADGSFFFTVSLKDGENTFELTATDPAGNVSSQSIVIVKTDKASPGAPAETRKESFFGALGGYGFLIGSVAAGILFIVFMLVFYGSFRKTWQTSRLLAVIGLCRNISIPFFAISAGYFAYTALRFRESAVYVASREFAEMGLGDPAAMYNAILINMQREDTYRTGLMQFIITGSVFIALLAASIACSAALKARAKRG